jgi:UDP-glucose 4-epimerase
MIEEFMGRKIERRYLSGRPFDVPISVLSNELAKQELGWVPKVRLADGISLTAEWMKRQLP